MNDQRTFGIYERTDSIYLGDPVETVEINHIPLDKLKSIISGNKDDPFLYDGYILLMAEIDQLNEFLEERIFPDFELYEYVMECYG